ncbi:alanine racemase [Stappia aggregata IAM 12614]|uniref:Alanine racemase n=1 Tax=Roseibium aggregatum (strain ATCC 25650 / DSM 13394 / JCM 20685 / NBRC 16684 / NCIMB 2208 / IAM 12614 / B1) TaxID=384765 RepID=A0NMU4_ROSAI|nr:alanine racemase [Roseibium aggregatum]EAV46389.1 alanine racemase [Stappia aggregata IAM 12614] [Roseibium aggregatum IAM 12614]
MPATCEHAFPSDLYGGRLTIDLDAIVSNWSLLKDKVGGGTDCAAVLKADAYGTGQDKTAAALYQAGCRTFFVAVPTEALTLRASLPDAVIYVLDGLFPGTAEHFLKHDIRPVLGSLEELVEWSEICRGASKSFPAAVHVNTGIHRLGLTPEEFTQALSDTAALGPFQPSLVMSHLACGSNPDHPMNRRQLKLFTETTAPFPLIPRSLANSAGVLLGPEYHFDVVRPGIALYGGLAIETEPNPMKPVAKVEARIMMVRDVPKGDTIGYGAKQTATRPLRNAVVAAGYADGMIRRAGSTDERPGGFGTIGGYKAPILGRISMDMITLDVTDVPDHLLRRGAFVEMLGPGVAASDLAAYAETIDYEYLTSLGRRFERVYAPLS